MVTRSVLVLADHSDDSDDSDWESDADPPPKFAVGTRTRGNKAREIASTLQQKLTRLENGIEGEEQGIHDYLVQLVCEEEQHVLLEVFDLSLAPALSMAQVERLALCRNSEGNTVPQHFILQNNVDAVYCWRSCVPVLADPDSSLLTMALNSGCVRLINVLVAPGTEFRSSSLNRPMLSAATLRGCFELSFDMTLRDLCLRTKHVLHRLFPSSEPEQSNNNSLFLLAVPLHRPDYLYYFTSICMVSYGTIQGKVLLR
ncbi:MAG: hypothetical protein MHM6MM_008993 [Cercozoa sp. M6MM]